VDSLGNKILEKDLLQQNLLFSGLKEESLHALIAVSNKEPLKEGQYLMREGDEAHELYFIIAGDLDIIKYDKETKTDFVVGKLHAGDTVGELAFIDKGQRSASVRASIDCQLLNIPFSALEELSARYSDINMIFQDISKRISKYLRQTTNVALIALKNELQEYKNRVSMGSFLIYVITAISLLVYTQMPLKYALAHVKDTSMISIPMIIALTLFAYLIIRACPFPMSTFGFTLKNTKKAVVESLYFTLPIMIFIVFAKWLIIHYVPKFKGDALFDPFALRPTVTVYYWIVNAFVYCLFVPIQEIMARGVLQGPLELFLVGKHKVWTAIIISNLIFSAAHVFLSEEIALAVFVMGIYFGWLYSRTYNLIGVIIAHCLIGIWGLSVVGVRIHG